MAVPPSLWLRWSWRDLRRRWILVVTIAVIIAIGTGVFAGLGSTAEWRRQSNDASYAALRMHDLRVALSPGTFVPEGTLVGAAEAAAGGDLAGAAERLIAPTQVDASTADRAVLVPGRLVGLAVDATGHAPVDDLYLTDGSGLRPAGDHAVLETKFARHHDLPAAGTVELAGGHELRYVGLGITPEYFLVMGDEGTFMAEAGFAVVFVPLQTAQRLSGQEGLVNDLSLRLEPGADRDSAAAALEAELARRLPDTGYTLTSPEDDPAHHILYEDIETDAQFWNLFATLLLLAAAFAAFNLVHRIVESQRREIGVGMALGVRPRALAVRPLLVGGQVALLGAVAGIGIGLLVGAGMRSLMESFIVLPEWHTPFQAGRYAQAAALGIAVPVAATVFPVWRAVRVEPVDAIRTIPRAPAGRGLHRAVGSRGSTFTRMPLRNVLRAPRRTVLTALGIAAAITSLVAVLGMLDSFTGTMDRAQHETRRQSPDRLVVTLDRFHGVDDGTLSAIADRPEVALVEPSLRLVGTLVSDGVEVDVLPEVRDLDSAVWQPTASRGELGRDGIVLAAKAAGDLGVEPGDRVVLRHPERVGPLSFRMTETVFPVAAVHPDPMRFTTFLHTTQAGRFGLEGAANAATVLPAAGHTQDDVVRALFGLPGVASVQPVGAMTDLMSDTMDEFVGVMRVAQFAVLALALLIAFNAASISADERAREQATMFAFGVPVRRVLRMAVGESALLGVAGTAVGVAGGYLVLHWVVRSLLGTTMPEIGVITTISAATLASTLVLGVAAVALAPVLTVRRLRRMDVPATLRVVE